MGIFSGVDCNGDSILTSTTNGPDSRLACAKAGIKAANQAASAAFSSVDETGLGSFEALSPGIARDVDLGTAGVQLIVSPGFDGNANSISDIEEVVDGLSALGGTNYFGGLQTADTILGASTNTNKLVIFISDGVNNQGSPVTTFVPTNFGGNTVIKAFALGAGAGVTCSDPGNFRGDLNDVAALTSGGTCTEITDFSLLADEITQSIGSTLTGLEIDVDGTGPVTITNAEIIPDLPQNGPVSVDYETTVTSLGAGTHDICVTVSGNDAGGNGSVTECIVISINSPPVCDDVVANIDSLWPPNHKLVNVSLSGATDPDGDAITLSIVSVSQDEPTNGLGDGDKTPDAIISGSSVDVRSERSGTGDGRVYVISFNAEDSNGASCMGSVNIGVPHDKKDTAVDNGQDFDSTSP